MARPIHVSHPPWIGNDAVSSSPFYIRNRLVKLVVWAYLQPMSTSPGSAGDNFFHRLWPRVNDKTVQVDNNSIDTEWWEIFWIKNSSDLVLFEVKPCSRAYSHDWTECPFVHPGENARLRVPVKYNYTCDPCPEFKMGSCGREILASTRTGFSSRGCTRPSTGPVSARMRQAARGECFFAHRPEELRPVYASTDSGLPSPKHVSGNSMDLSMLSPLSLGLPKSSTPPMSPAIGCSSLMGGDGGRWQSKAGLTLPALQLPGSRLKTDSSARDIQLENIILPNG